MARMKRFEAAIVASHDGIFRYVVLAHGWLARSAKFQIDVMNKARWVVAVVQFGTMEDCAKVVAPNVTIASPAADLTAVIPGEVARVTSFKAQAAHKRLRLILVEYEEG